MFSVLLSLSAKYWVQIFIKNWTFVNILTLGQQPFVLKIAQSPLETAFQLERLSLPELVEAFYNSDLKKDWANSGKNCLQKPVSSLPSRWLFPKSAPDFSDARYPVEQKTDFFFFIGSYTNTHCRVCMCRYQYTGVCIYRGVTNFTWDKAHKKFHLRQSIKENGLFLTTESILQN